jgi:hypothetical protein
LTIRDRGNIKWTSLMLPEHVRELRKYLNEEYYDIPEPILDGEQMNEMNLLVLESMEFHFPLQFTLYKQKRLIPLEGYVHFVDHIKQEFRVVDFDEYVHHIPLHQIKNIHKYEEARDA